MTIEVNYNPIRQQGNGVTTQFSYDFYALSDQYLVVYIEEDGVQTVTTDYTATVSETGGIVTFNSAPTENQYVVITRSTTINQEVPYTTSRGFDAKVVESSFDKDIAISQELQNQLTRTPKLPEGYNYNIQLPNPDDGKALVWNGNQGVIRNSNYTLEESMARAAASAELSKDWAEKTTGLVSGDFSSKAYAIGGTGTETNNAKYYASQASNSADIAYAAATNENVVAVGTDLRTDNNIGAVVGNATNINSVAGNATNINNVASNRTNINTVATNIANVNTNATNINAINTNASNISVIQSAYSNAQSALNSKNLAQEWAVSENFVDNTDYSAKYYAEVAQTNAELSEQYANDKINQTHITNCITEIPQDIKLELNNGTLTLKAGSKVYVPNGFNGTTPKFDVVTIGNDITSNGVSFTGDCFYFVGNNALHVRAINQCSTFTTPPTQPISGIYEGYCSSDNKMYIFKNDTQTWVISGQSFPICIVTLNTSTPCIRSLNQIFNGFGYIGSTVFALPGVKGLIPNGRNADGTLKNIEIVSSQVWTRTWLSNPNYHDLSLASFGIGINTNPYNANENFVYNAGGAKVTDRVVFGRMEYNSSSPWNVTKLLVKTVFHAVDYNDVVLKTDIQVVSALPANPDSNTFYFIPE